MATYTDLYIDEVYIDVDDNGSGDYKPYTGLDNSGGGESISIGDSGFNVFGSNNSPLTDLSNKITDTNSFATGIKHRDTGYKYKMQLSNGSSSTITLSSSVGYKVRLCMNYQKAANLGSYGTSYYDYEFIINHHSIGTISGKTEFGVVSSIYLGWGLGTGQSVVNTYSLMDSTSSRASDVYLNFMVDTGNGETLNNALCDLRIHLFKTTDGGENWTHLDTAGGNGSYAVGSPSAQYFAQGKTDSGIIGRLMASTDLSGEGKIAGIGPGKDGSFKRLAGEGYDAPSTTYTSSDWGTATGNFLNTSAAGDPHITTLNGEHYKFDYLGAFRLLEHNVNNNNLIINGFSELGKGRWYDKQYIKKVYINYNGKDILIDTGFRGTPVNILNNNGIEFIEKKLEFDKDARRYSMSGKGIGKKKGVSKNSNEPVTDDLPLLIRNQITILLHDEINNLMSITIENVNKYNLQPCRLFVNLNKNGFKNDKGCLIDRKYVNVSKLSSIDDTTKLREPDENDLLNIPELEIQPKLLNIQYE